MLNIKKLIKSFRHAFRGLWYVFREEQNFRVHVALGLLVIFLSTFLSLNSLEFVIILLSISGLLFLEIINTAFEKIIDVLKPRVHHYAGIIKDIMAAAVFIGAITCALAVIIIFVPKIVQLFD